MPNIKMAIIELTSRVPNEAIDTTAITELLQEELFMRNAFTHEPINLIPVLAANIAQKTNGENETQPKITTVKNPATENTQTDNPTITANIAPFLVVGDKIYSYPENNHCYLAQEITVNSVCFSLDKKSGINLIMYDYYQEEQPGDRPLDISKYNRLHFELKSEHKGPFSISLNRDIRHTNFIDIDYNSNDFKSYNFPLTSFGANLTALTKITAIGFSPNFIGQNQYTIRNVYFLNSKTQAKYRIAQIYRYIWKQNDSLKISESSKIIEAELDYDPISNVIGLGVILNCNPYDYHSTIDLTSYKKLIIDLKGDITEINLTIDGGTPYPLTGVSDNYSTFSIPLIKLNIPVVDWAHSRELKIIPITSKNGKLYIRNIRFERKELIQKNK